MKLHPLHSVQQIIQHMNASGEYFPQDRCTGRTEQLALRAVANAMAYPHKWHELRDHFDHRVAHQHLRDKCQRIVYRMGYTGFTFRDTAICFGDTSCRG